MKIHDIEIIPAKPSDPVIDPYREGTIIDDDDTDFLFEVADATFHKQIKSVLRKHRQAKSK